jgi:hypothetical protein
VIAVYCQRKGRTADGPVGRNDAGQGGRRRDCEPLDSGWIPRFPSGPLGVITIESFAENAWIGA